MFNAIRHITTALRLARTTIGSSGKKTRQTHAARLAVESLEDRCVPAGVLTVSNLNDIVNADTRSINALVASPGADGISLREAIQAANNTAGADAIIFLPGLNGVINLTGGQMNITEALTITGNGADKTIIDAQRNSRIFNATSRTGDLTLDGLTLRNGRTTADFDGGGAVSFVADSTLTIRNSTLSGNSTTGGSSEGGAVWVALGELRVINSTLSGNSTTGTLPAGGGKQPSLGGAIFAAFTKVTVINSTLSGNSTAGAGANGGAIWAGDLGAVAVTNSTIAFNTAANGVGGGIFSNSDPVTVTNSIVAKNSDNGSAPDMGTNPRLGGVPTARSSLVGNNTGTGLTAAPVGAPDANGNLIGTNINPIDPKLAPLANNGGGTPTHALLPGSPARDAGNDALALDANGVALTADQRGNGFARILGGRVDMGAFEAVPEQPSIDKPVLGKLTFTQVMNKKNKRLFVQVKRDGKLVKTLGPFAHRVKTSLKSVNRDGVDDVVITDLATKKSVAFSGVDLNTLSLPKGFKP